MLFNEELETVETDLLTTASLSDNDQVEPEEELENDEEVSEEEEDGEEVADEEENEG